LKRALRIAVVGDFDPEFRSHVATNEALQHAAKSLKIAARVEWVPTPVIAPENPRATLGGFDALWISAGSPYRSMEGALAAIRMARMEGWPMFAT
jgi:CTP synthase (UTP-ammonia lyase)